MFLDSLSPGQILHLDYLEYEGKHIFILKDQYSGWSKFYLTSDMTSQSAIKSLKDYFNNFGLPHKIVSDSGPSFRSGVFKEFLQSHHILHHFTSSYRSSSAGLVERGVRSLKDVLKKVSGPITKELLDTITFKLNQHISSGQGSASMRFLGRAPRSDLPNSQKRSVDRDDLVKSCMEKQIKLAEKKGRQSRDVFKNGNKVLLRCHKKRDGFKKVW